MHKPWMEQRVSEMWKRQSADDRRDVDRVRDASRIERIVGEHVALKPKGREYVGLCPFHDDHNPSMRVVPSKQIFHCFVCAAGGDVLSFVQRFHKMDFPEALEYLAERAGITLERRQRGAAGAEDGPTKRELIAACEAAREFYQKALRGPGAGETARRVISSRGISPEMVTQFALGAAPDDWEGLSRAMMRTGQREATLVGAGLAKRRESGGCFDMLRHRLVFPICDRAGRVVAFGGRRLKDEDEPKYLNTPETALFDKSATLYGLHLAQRSIQAQRTALITEGYMDAIACHQAGFTNAVATLGTALTAGHAGTLRQTCDTVVLLFDGDDAGRRAADRAVGVFFAERLDVRIATLSALTDAKDPDELLKRPDGAEVFRRVIAEAKDLLEYRFARVRAGLAGGGIAAVSRAVEEEIASLVEMGLRDVEPLRQTLIIKRLASVAGVEESLIRRMVPAGRRGAVGGGATVQTMESRGAAALPVNAAGTLSLAEELLGCVLCEGALWRLMGERELDAISPGEQRHETLKRLAQLVMDIGEDGLEPGLDAVLSATEDESVKASAVRLAQRVSVQTEGLHERLKAHWDGCVGRVRAGAVRLAEGATLAERLEEIKRVKAAQGADRRVLPRSG
ncbi:MAG: DNA primase [Phycisphaeraceae bacterium]|nr:DNA primase [Phycisphaeraceae bacterium]